MRSATGDLLAAGNGGAWFSSPLTSSRSLTSPDASESATDYSALDIDGDGWDDLWRRDPASGTAAYYGPVTTLAAADLSLTMPGGFTQFLTAGDVNGDGHTDLLATTPNGASGKGAAYVWFGTTTRRTGLIGPSDATRQITGPSSATPVYWSAFAGDIDGDGADDILASASVASGSPSTGWLIYGSSLATGDVTAGSDVAYILPAQTTAGAPMAVSGDWNDDGRSDVLWLLPAAQSNGSAGVAFMVFGQGI